MSRPEHLQAVITPPEGWTPASWRGRQAMQQPTYGNADELDGVLNELHALPPLVTSREVMNLRQQLAEAMARSDSDVHRSRATLTEIERALLRRLGELSGGIRKEAGA